MTILIIEDNREIRENIAEILELENYYVFVAEDGLEGLQTALECKPDIIICDVVMPGLGGYDVIKVLKEDFIAGSIPVIFLSAKAEKSDYHMGMELGAAGYLIKPFDDAELLNAIKSKTKE